MSWLDDLHANDPAYPPPGAGDPWQAPPTADWAVLARQPQAAPGTSGTTPGGEPPVTSVSDLLLPTRADLDAATATTAAVLADPAASRAERELAAEMEQAAHILYLQRPGADAELQAEAEMEAGS